jgi:hypothetical protein
MYQVHEIEKENSVRKTFMCYIFSTLREKFSIMKDIIQQYFLTSHRIRKIYMFDNSNTQAKIKKNHAYYSGEKNVLKSKEEIIELLKRRKEINKFE